MRVRRINSGQTILQSERTPGELLVNTKNYVGIRDESSSDRDDMFGRLGIEHIG